MIYSRSIFHFYSVSAAHDRCLAWISLDTLSCVPSNSHENGKYFLLREFFHVYFKKCTLEMICQTLSPYQFFIQVQ